MVKKQDRKTMVEADIPLDDLNSGSGSSEGDNNDFSKERVHKIAHTLANLLTAISGNVSMLRQEPAVNDEMASMLDETTEAVAQAADLTRRLLLLSEKGASRGRVVLRETESGRMPMQRRRILFVDDEEPVRKSMKRLLHRLGYESETARSGEEAVLLYTKARQQAEAPFDAVILDLVFSEEEQGESILKDLMDIDSSAKIILTSGTLSTDDLTTYLKKGFDGVLPKPFSLADIENTLKTLLG